MVDPFEPASVLKGSQLRNRKILMIVFIPLIIFSVLALAAFVVSIVAFNRAKVAQVHPDCACRKIMEENPISARHQPLMLLADPEAPETWMSPKNGTEEPPKVYRFD